MFELFLLLYAALIVTFLVQHARRRNRDHIFSPWPGYPILFSTYFLFGTLTLTTPVTDGQWLVYSLAIVGFWFGSVVVRASFRRLPASEITLAEQKDYFVRSFNVPLAALASVAGLAITLYLWQGSGIPLLSQNVDDARTSMVSNGYVAQLATMLDVASIFSLAYILAAWGQRRSSRFWVCTLIVFIFVVVALLSGSRSRFLKLAIPGVVLFHFLVRPIRLKWVLALAFGGIMFIGALGYYRWFSLWGELNRAEGPTLADVFSYAAYELSTAAYGLDIVLKQIPSSTPFTDGYLHLGPFTTPFGSGIPTPGEFFKQMIGGRWAGFGLAATFLAPMYADFSFIGVFVLSAMYCAFLMLMYRSTQNNRRARVYYIALYATIFFFVSSGIRSDWLSFEFIWFTAISASFLLLRRRLSPVDRQPKRSFVTEIPNSTSRTAHGNG
jgi:oligosaccharide repeat unit polymerase